MSARTELLSTLRASRFDVLVIGGGIVGAGIARDAAMRGLRVALIEQGDFASGTSSKTSKLIHGGLRYLEQGRVRLVCESLRERHILRTIAPQLVRPLSLMIPLYRGDARPPWKVAAGLWLYNGLAFGRNLQAHRMLSAREAIRREAGLSQAGLRAAAVYADCEMDDARLCLANILQAVGFGAVCCNYMRLVAFERTDSSLTGAVVEDLLTAQTWSVRASVIVNATGPWSDTVRRMSDQRVGHRLAPTKGIHLIVPRLTHQPLCAPVRRERRMLFLLPRGEYTVIGTTESDDVRDLHRLRATAGEVEYLLDEINRLIPGAQLRSSDVVATYAGARPLLAHAGSATSASREHTIEVDRFGLVSVMGGKFTTYRAMARQVVDLIAARAPRRTERCLTDQVSLLEPTHPVVLDRWQEITRQISAELMSRLLGTYGAGALRILRLLEFEPQLAKPVCPHHEYIYAELVHAAQDELACTISDLLVRRTTIAYSYCQGLDMLSTLKDLLQRYCRYAPDVLEGQATAYRHWLADSVAFRTHGLRTARRPSPSDAGNGSSAVVDRRAESLQDAGMPEQDDGD